MKGRHLMLYVLMICGHLTIACIRYTAITTQYNIELLNPPQLLTNAISADTLSVIALVHVLTYLRTTTCNHLQ